jgi:hypothetical protein
MLTNILNGRFHNYVQATYSKAKDSIMSSIKSICKRNNRPPDYLTWYLSDATIGTPLSDTPCTFTRMVVLGSAL